MTDMKEPVEAWPASAVNSGRPSVSQSHKQRGNTRTGTPGSRYTRFLDSSSSSSESRSSEESSDADSTYEDRDDHDDNDDEDVDMKEIGKKAAAAITGTPTVKIEPEFGSRLNEGCRFRCELCGGEFLYDIHVSHLATNHDLSVEKYVETYGPVTMSKVWAENWKKNSWWRAPKNSSDWADR